jgi:hypothetical protein
LLEGEVVTLHTSFTRGKRVFVKLRNGTSFIDKFIERGRAHVTLFKYGDVDIADIKSMTIAKVRPH